MSNRTAKTDQWLDGPRLVKWLEECGIEDKTDAYRKRVQQWAGGSAANVHTVDRFLMTLDRSLGEVPWDVYLDYEKKNKRNGQGQVLRHEDARFKPLTEDQKDTLRLCFKRKVPPGVIAKQLRMNYYTVIRLREEWKHDTGDSRRPRRYGRGDVDTDRGGTAARKEGKRKAAKRA